MSPQPAACMTLHGGVIYGPIHSRRFGTSLGINLLPAGRKVCSFNCVYCQYSWTEPLRTYDDLDWPSPSTVADETERAIAMLTASGVVLDRLTIAGHGEPTLHPGFAAAVDALRVMRDRVAPRLPLGILSNSTTAHLPDVRAALMRLDRRDMKLDVGRQDDLRRVNASSVPVGQIVDALAALPDVAIQSMFVRDPRRGIDNAAEPSVEAWLTAIARIAPVQVQVYTVARTPALATLEAVPAAVLRDIAARVESLGIPAVAVV